MKYIMVDPDVIKFSLRPTTRVEKIIQRVGLLLSVEEGTQPLNRGFGLNLKRFQDMPVSYAIPELAQQLALKIMEYIPEARFKQADIRFDNITGKMTPIVYIDIV